LERRGSKRQFIGSNEPSSTQHAASPNGLIWQIRQHIENALATNASAFIRAGMLQEF
jgi:hypothetical protein